jgi:competence protein ComGC
LFLYHFFGEFDNDISYSLGSFDIVILIIGIILLILTTSLVGDKEKITYMKKDVKTSLNNFTKNIKIF